MHDFASTGAFSMSCPQTETCPVVGEMKPAIMRMVVDLPAPLAPKKPSTSPGATENVRSSTASLSPYRLDRFLIVIIRAFEPRSLQEVPQNIILCRRAARAQGGPGYYELPAFLSIASLFSFKIRLTSGRLGRSAMRAISSGSSNHFLPHCTKRAASAITWSRAASEGPARSGCAAGFLAGAFGAGFKAAAGLRSLRATCAVPGGGGVRLVPRNLGISRV